MFWRGMVLLVAAVLLCGCETTQRNGLDYAAMTQKVGPPKAGHGRVVMLREKDFANIADRAFEFQLDGVPVQGLKTGTYVYVDRPAGQHQLTANEAGFPGVTERAFRDPGGPDPILPGSDERAKERHPGFVGEYGIVGLGPKHRHHLRLQESRAARFLALGGFRGPDHDRGAAAGRIGAVSARFRPIWPA
ncbi:hypothetical protein ACVILK_001038 [Bradyrhizobium embrapense]